MYFSRDSRVRRPGSRCACVFLAKTSRYIVRNNRPESPRGRRESCRALGPRYSAVIRERARATGGGGGDGAVQAER